MLEMTAGLNIRDDVVVCPVRIVSMGPCMPVTLYGCVMDGVFLCSDYSYGNKSRFSGDIRSDSRIIDILDVSGSEMNLSPYNDRNVSIATMYPGFMNGALFQVRVNGSEVKDLGNITRPVPVFISRPLEQYRSEKEKSSRIEKSDPGSPSFFSQLFSFLTGKEK
jgi:hypothetical protein